MPHEAAEKDVFYEFLGRIMPSWEEKIKEGRDLAEEKRSIGEFLNEKEFRERIKGYVGEFEDKVEGRGEREEDVDLEFYRKYWLQAVRDPFNKFYDEVNNIYLENMRNIVLQHPSFITTAFFDELCRKNYAQYNVKFVWDLDGVGTSTDLKSGKPANCMYNVGGIEKKFMGFHNVGEKCGLMKPPMNALKTYLKSEEFGAEQAVLDLSLSPIPANIKRADAVINSSLAESLGTDRRGWKYNFYVVLFNALLENLKPGHNLIDERFPFLVYKALKETKAERMYISTLTYHEFASHLLMPINFFLGDFDLNEPKLVVVGTIDYNNKLIANWLYKKVARFEVERTNPFSHTFDFAKRLETIRQEDISSNAILPEELPDDLLIKQPLISYQFKFDKLHMITDNLTDLLNLKKLDGVWCYKMKAFEKEKLNLRKEKAQKLIMIEDIDDIVRYSQETRITAIDSFCFGPSGEIELIEAIKKLKSKIDEIDSSDSTQMQKQFLEREEFINSLSYLKQKYRFVGNAPIINAFLSEVNNLTGVQKNQVFFALRQFRQFWVNDEQLNNLKKLEREAVRQQKNVEGYKLWNEYSEKQMEGIRIQEEESALADLPFADYSVKVADFLSKSGFERERFFNILDEESYKKAFPMFRGSFNQIACEGIR